MRLAARVLLAVASAGATVLAIVTAVNREDWRSAAWALLAVLLLAELLERSRDVDEEE